MPFEPSTVVLECCHIYLHYIGQCKSRGQNPISDTGECALPPVVGVTVKSPGKERGYTVLPLSAPEELRMTLYLTTSTLLSMFYIPLTSQINLLSHKTQQSLSYDT